ncbi:PTS sugar transporter subunit IIA [Vagococcus sp. BWB3-3]|uniref:PTS sugar transporter subunit IIA n=1 Tax=Vagococcus allomyrinae TaxID=2794353 RepID=A0A940SVA4_9ENTE|nr:PTS sugar transporter subunit IIA [Vagococcus allomyrinae]MBP1040886.1 PTS sugar transporter subunit IIA [Vagococcus allomyrinae]
MKKLLYDTKEKFMFCRFQAEKRTELLEKMSDVLIAERYVKDSYKEAVILREKEFPTGLPTKGISVAIPHTESQHVIHEGFLVGIVETPVIFEVMASPGEEVPVEIIFMLAIKEPENQLVMLQKLIGLCQNERALAMIKEGKEVESINQLLREII